MAIKIFLSCDGNKWEHLDNFIKSLKAKNHEFVNESTIGSGNLEQNKKLIDQCDWVFIFITKNSVERTGHCLKEHEYAKNAKKGVLPILVDEKANIPMGLLRTQWVPFTKTINDGKFDQEYFDFRIQEIDDILTGKVNEQLVHKVFISYGHDKYADILVKKIAKELKERNLTPWIDYDYLYGSSDWETKIEQGIEKTTWVLFFITEHSMKRPEGYCLKEITYARSKGKEQYIIPVAVQEIDMPISIIEKPQIDFSKAINDDGSINEKEYEKSFNKICDVLTGKLKLDYKDPLKDKLQPLDNVRFIQANPNFYGRKWLFDAYEKWLKEEDSKVLCILGNAGSGKSAFMSQLCETHPNIHAIHFCYWKDPMRVEPLKIIKSLAFHLSKQIPQYRDILLKDDNWDCISKIDNPTTLFESLFTNPLLKIDSKEQVVIVIDALDEATNRITGKNDILDLIINEFKHTPKWLRLVVTSRPESKIERSLRELNPIVISNISKENIDDIAGYLKKSLKKSIEELNETQKKKVVDTIVQKSEGNFLYATLIAKDLETGQLHVENLDKSPSGLVNYYKFNFERLFEPNKCKFDYDKIRLLMAVLVAEYEPIDNTVMSEILGINKYEFAKIAEYLSTLFPIKNDCIVPIHKSVLDWLSKIENSGADFYVDEKDGHEIIAKYFLDKKYSSYAIKHLVFHCLKTNEPKRAIDILNDAKAFEENIKIWTIGTALKRHLIAIIKLHKIDKESAISVMNNKLFIDIFAEYRKYFSLYDLYNQLSEIDFDEVIYNLDFSKCSLKMKSSLINYFIATDDMDEIIKMLEYIFEKNDIEDVLVYLELMNKISPFALMFGGVTLGLELAKQTIDIFNSEKSITDEQLCEFTQTYITLGDAYLYKLDFDESLKQYSNAWNILKKINKQTKNRDLKYATVLNASCVLAKISLNFAWQLKPKEAIYWKDKAIKYFKKTRKWSSVYVNKSAIFALLFASIFEGKDCHNSDYYESLNDLMKSNMENAIFEFYYTLYLYVTGNIEEAKDQLEYADLDASESGMPLLMDQITILHNKITPEDPWLLQNKDSADIIAWTSYIDKTIDKLVKLIKDSNGGH